ncbi:hypothetical protein KGF54_000344 [Candida jiufengensis]|uniref:uncharacterized protein n=1 Tax=Candida jiufengensis TaxID=497108 RepID=UPI0022256BD4|nr:uncharacterized protein KGF54_000344 [Candida jiufengensis]KAI5956727.1 hypothetical protein KGF54_000344 [Candida jiufengensis]
MSNLEDIKLNPYSLRVFLNIGFQQYIDNIVKNLSEGEDKTLYSRNQQDYDKLESEFHFISQSIMTTIDRTDFDEAKYLPKFDMNNKNSTLSIESIENILCGRNLTPFRYTKVKTKDLILRALFNQDEEVFINNREQVASKILNILYLVLETYPEFKFIENDSNKSLGLYCLKYLESVSSLFSSSSTNQEENEVLFTSACKYLKNDYSEDIPYNKFFECFETVFTTILKYIISSSNSKNESNFETFNKLREIGNNLMSFQSFGQAIKVYTEALTIEPKYNYEEDSQIYTNRAIAFIGINCVPEAIDDLNSALVIDKAFAPAWTQLGYCHLYMGNGLMALECYSIALKCAVGEILPYRFPRDKKIVEEYRELRQKTILPQFVERLSAAIALTEKRAYQQKVPEAKIKKIVSEVRKTLAHLRAIGPEGDRDYFTYMPVYRDSTLRNLSERANANRPNILTPEVSQNMLARNGMETATITQIDAIPHNDAPRATTTTTGVSGPPNNNNNNGPRSRRTNGFSVTAVDADGNPVDGLPIGNIADFIDEYDEGIENSNNRGDNRGLGGLSQNVSELLGAFTRPQQQQQSEQQQQQQQQQQQNQNTNQSQNTNPNTNTNTTTNETTNTNETPNLNQNQNQSNVPPDFRSISDAIVQGLGNVFGPSISNTLQSMGVGTGGTSGSNVFVNGVDVTAIVRDSVRNHFENQDQNQNQNLNQNQNPRNGSTSFQTHVQSQVHSEATNSNQQPSNTQPNNSTTNNPNTSSSTNANTEQTNNQTQSDQDQDLDLD